MFKRIISYLLTIVIATSLTIPVFAQSENKNSFAFEFPFMVANEEKTIQLYKDGKELYIAHDSVPLLGEIKDHGSYFERSDGASIILDNNNTMSFDGINYHSFEDIMIKLCLNSIFVEKGSRANADKDMVVIVPANNIFNIPSLSNRILDTPEINLYGYNHEYYKAKAEEADANKSILSKLKDKVVFKFYIADGVEVVHSPKEFETYNAYRTALWDIMLPQSTEITWADNYYNDALQGIKQTEFIAMTNEGVATLVTKPEGFLSRGIGNGINIAEILSVEGGIDALEFAYNIDNIDSSIGNALTIIQKQTSTNDSNLKNAVNDTVSLYNKDMSPSKIYCKQIANELVKQSANTIDILFEANIYTKAIKLVFDGYDLYSKGTYDKSLKESYEIAFSTLAVQNLTGKAIRQTSAELRNTSDSKKQAVLIKDLRDLLIVYLIAGNNTWEAIGDEDEFRANKADTLYAIEKYFLPKLTSLSYVDFEVYFTAKETKEKLLTVNPESTSSTTSTEPTDESMQIESNQFIVSTKNNDYIITYDNSLFKLEARNYGTGMTINFVEEIATKLNKYYGTTVEADDSFKNFDEYYETMKFRYPMEYNENSEVQGVKYGTPVDIKICDEYTVKYLEIDYVSNKEPDKTVLTNSYCYLDMNNGEGFYWYCWDYEKHLDTIGISHEEFIQKLFVDIEVISKQ